MIARKHYGDRYLLIDLNSSFRKRIEQLLESIDGSCVRLIGARVLRQLLESVQCLCVLSIEARVPGQLLKIVECSCARLIEACDLRQLL